MRLVSAAGLVLASILVLVVAHSDHLAATTLSPTQTVILTPSTAGANAVVNIEYVVDSPQAWPGVHTSFIPPEFIVANDAAIPNGAGVGQISTTSVFTNNNGPCNTGPTVFYDLQDASTDTSITINDTPRLPGAWPGLTDADANTLLDGVDKYPNFLKVLYPGLTPRARQFGFVDDGGVNRVVNVLIFEQGTALPGLPAFSSTLGYPAVVVEQDPTTPPEPSSRGDSCTPLTVNRADLGATTDHPGTAASEGGFTYRTNPTNAGSYGFVSYFRALRDRDDDGIENTLDSCPTNPDPGWDPRGNDFVDDQDGDGLPLSCDPAPTTANADQDGDGYQNRQDNCPLVANGLSGTNQADGDRDGIGDACDSQPAIADGHIHEVCVTTQVQVGSGGSTTTPACPDFTNDEDFDGFSDVIEQHIGTGVYDPCGNNGWPADLQPTNSLNIGDINSFLFPLRPDQTFNKFGHTVPDPNDPNLVRWDFDGNNTIGIADINALNPAVQAPTARPPMLGGVPAFGLSCPYPP
jgi:hypothetical protein